MNLHLFFKLIVGVIFQKEVSKKFANPFLSHQHPYRNIFFSCPRIVANDGFSICASINRHAYCRSDKGFQEYSLDWQIVECYGQHKYNEKSKSVLAAYIMDKSVFTDDTVISIPIKKLEEVFSIHGGINWELTIENVENF